MEHVVDDAPEGDEFWTVTKAETIPDATSASGLQGLSDRSVH